MNVSITDDKVWLNPNLLHNMASLSFLVTTSLIWSSRSFPVWLGVSQQKINTKVETLDPLLRDALTWGGSCGGNFFLQCFRLNIKQRRREKCGSRRRNWWGENWGCWRRIIFFLFFYMKSEVFSNSSLRSSSPEVPLCKVCNTSRMNSPVMSFPIGGSA